VALFLQQRELLSQVRFLLLRIPVLKHIFSHTAHHAVALWALGANEQALRKGYETDKSFQLDAIKASEEITKANWKQHLGEDRSVPTSIHQSTEPDLCF
jgi:hypothetical protein